MRRPRPPKTALQGLMAMLWRQPLFAIPFGVFFGTVFGRMPGSFWPALKISLIFAYCIGLATWAVEYLLKPQTDSKPGAWRKVALYYGVASMGASMIAAFIIDFTILPGFVRGGRSLAMVLMFSAIFCTLFMGVALAMNFYRDTLERVKSDSELNLARRIQRSFLLSSFPEHPRLEVHAVNVSSRHVSGDFYDVVPAGEDAFLIAIADVAGKGVPAALLSSMLQASLRTQALTIPSVADILVNINTLVYRSTAVNQFATFFLARVDEKRLRLSFSNAGHNFPLLFRKSGERITLERGGTVVGILETAAFEEDTVELGPGDRLVLYTDGINEAANSRNELFGDERLVSLIESLPADLSSRELTERILEGVRTFLDGEEPGDDMTVLVLRVLEPAATTDGHVVTRPAEAIVPAPAPR